MANVRVLSAEDIAKVFTITDALEAVEEAYHQKALGSGIAWPMVYEAFEPGVSDMDIRSGQLGKSGIFGLKLTAWFSQNPSQGLPDIFGTTLICDDKNGAPLALLNASAITGLRTGAAAALGVKWLARNDARKMLVAGAGHMAAYVIAATLTACSNIEEIEVWDPRKTEAPVARVQSIRESVSSILKTAGINRAYAIEPTGDGEHSAQDADVIITVTPATTPIIKDGWVTPGTHLSCVGADMKGKQEVASGIHAAARLFVDDRAQSVSAGELEVPCKEGAIKPKDIIAELGDVIAGNAEGRLTNSDITVFDTSGIAVQDLASSKIAYDRAVEADLGTIAPL